MPCEVTQYLHGSNHAVVGAIVSPSSLERQITVLRDTGGAARVVAIRGKELLGGANPLLLGGRVAVVPHVGPGLWTCQES